MLSFRKKLLFSDLLLFLAFTALLLPFFGVRFLLLSGLILLLYSLMTWAMVHRLTRPIQQILDAILPYQEGREELLPHIPIETIPRNEFGKLAFTLNSLTLRIQKQIENLKQQKKETEGILESLGEGIVATDTSARVTFANQAACRMLGAPHEAILKHPLDRTSAQAKDLCCKGHEMVLHALQTLEPSVESWMLEDNRKTYLNLISAPLTHQKGALLVIQDKTSDYKMVAMGKDFIANASHELRTPITIIRGFAETLQDLQGLPESSPELLKEIAEKIVRTCGRLDKLVRSLLTLADIENLSEDRLSPADLVVLAENGKHLLLAAHPQTEISIESSAEKAPVVADSDLLDLAILNLLENAVKYSSAPARIRVAVSCTDTEARLSISDRGIGISETDLPHIFDRFYTVDKARSRKSGGAGLGLSIVKTIVEKHKGRIEALSTLGKGSSFTLCLPLAQLD